MREYLSVRLIYTSFISIHHIDIVNGTVIFFHSPHGNVTSLSLSSSPFWSHSSSFRICTAYNILFCGDVCFQNKSGFHIASRRTAAAKKKKSQFHCNLKCSCIFSKMKYERKYTNPYAHTSTTVQRAQLTHTTAAALDARKNNIIKQIQCYFIDTMYCNNLK